MKTEKEEYNKSERAYLEKLGRRIYSERTQRKMTQKELGEKVGLTRVQIWRMESGTNATNIIKLLRIAEVLDIKLEQLMNGIR